MRVKKSAAVLAELEQIRRNARAKVVTPEAVVDFAQAHPQSALGRQIPRDADSALREQQLAWARAVIRVNVIVIPFEGEEITVHPYVSLSTRRGEGYERIEVVLGSKPKRRQLLLDVLDRLEQVDELKLFPELKPIADAIARARAKYAQKKRAALIVTGPVSRHV